MSRVVVAYGAFGMFPGLLQRLREWGLQLGEVAGMGNKLNDPACMRRGIGLIMVPDGYAQVQRLVGLCCDSPDWRGVIRQVAGWCPRGVEA